MCVCRIVHKSGEWVCILYIKFEQKESHEYGQYKFDGKKIILGTKAAILKPP